MCNKIVGAAVGAVAGAAAAAGFLAHAYSEPDTSEHPTIVVAVWVAVLTVIVFAGIGYGTSLGIEKIKECTDFRIREHNDDSHDSQLSQTPFSVLIVGRPDGGYGTNTWAEAPK